MGGSDFVDNGDGTYMESSESWQAPAGYSWLDLYLMGLARAEEAPNFFLLTGRSGSGSSPLTLHDQYMHGACVPSRTIALAPNRSGCLRDRPPRIGCFPRAARLPYGSKERSPERFLGSRRAAR